MEYWNLVWLVVMLGFAVGVPVIMLVVAARGLGADTLSEKQRRAGEKVLREAGIVRAGEAWEARDLDELMLNMRQHDQYQLVGAALTILLTSGAGVVALITAADGWVNSSVYLTTALGILNGSVVLGVSVGYVASDRSFAARAGELPVPQRDAIFSGAGEALRRTWWLRWLDVGLVVAVSICTLLYTLGKGGPLEDTTVRPAVARHPWLIWCIPVAACVIVAAREILVWWERRRPPLLLTEQPELAGRADLYRRREVWSKVYELTPVSMLVFVQLVAFSSQALFSIEFPLLIVALGSVAVGAFAEMRAESRRTRQGQRAGDAGLDGGGGAV